MQHELGITLRGAGKSLELVPTVETILQPRTECLMLRHLLGPYPQSQRLQAYSNATACLRSCSV